MTAQATAADLVAQRLAAAGCAHAFGIPGGEVLTIMAALERAGVAFTLVKHENAGGFMAEGAHHAAALTGGRSDTPGVLLATIGPGLVNGVNTVVNALQDQVPLIVISGAASATEAATYTHQVFDQCAVMRPITKASLSLADGAVDVLIDRAVAIAVSDPQGPVHVDLATALAAAPQPAPRRYHAPLPAAAGPAPGPALDQARRRVAAARKPLLLAGVGAVRAGAGAALRAAAERLGAPIVTTYKAKGLVDEDHPLALGGHGLSPKSDALVLPLLAEADLILSVGYDPIEMRHGWIDPFAPDRHVELTAAPNRHGMHGAAVSFVGDVRAGLESVLEGAPPRSDSWPDSAPTTVREALKAAFTPGDEWGPGQAFAAARRVSPSETVVTADSGAHRILLSQMWRCASPRTLLQSSALCTMGVALPLAMGVKRAAPDRPVLAVMGDAGLEMTLGELSTLRDWRVGGFCLLVMVDESLGLIELKQRRSGLDNLGVDFGGADWPAVAAALGGVGVWADDVDGLTTALSDGYARETTFTLVAARIGRRAYDGAF